MNTFRFAIGSASCRNKSQMSKGPCPICEHLFFKLETAGHLTYEQLSHSHEVETEEVTISGKKVYFTTYRMKLENGDLLLVIQAFLRTWKSPNYFSTAGIGRIFVEGLLIKATGEKLEAPKELLWEFK